MNPSQHSPRRRRTIGLGAEALETRALLTAGTGNTFAVVPGTVTTAGGTATVSFTIDPRHFTLPKQTLQLGIDVVPSSGSKVVPLIGQVSGPDGKPIHGMIHSIYAPSVPRSSLTNGLLTSATMTPISLKGGKPGAPETFTVQVAGLHQTSGGFLLGFYLPGDVNGDGTVDATDIKAIKSEMHLNAKSTGYKFDADANRDGKIGPIDLQTAQKNLGVKLDISPVVTANLDPASDSSGVGSRLTNIQTVHFTGAVSPDAKVTYSEIHNNTGPVTTTADASGNYSINVPLGLGSNTFHVTTLDSFGQSIQGNIAAVTYSPTAKPGTSVVKS